jgi:regulatory protein
MDLSQSTIYERLMNAAIRFISFRQRSEKELRDFIRQKLARSHTSAPEVEHRVLQRLGELGYVDDEKFSAWWVSQRRGSTPKGMRVIRAELQEKGIAAEIIAKVVKHSSSDERELARKSIQKKLTVWGYLPLLARKKKLGDFLLRRGFSAEIVWGVVDDIV